METFEQAWARMAAQGYQYGEEALEHVKLGWKLKCNSIWDSIADGWDENVQYLLNRCPYTIWQRPGGGQVDMLSSLIVTFLGMQQKLDNFSGTNPLTNAEIIDIVKSVHGGMHILEEYPYTLPLLIAAVEQAILQRKKEPKC